MVQHGTIRWFKINAIVACLRLLRASAAATDGDERIALLDLICDLNDMAEDIKSDGVTKGALCDSHH